MDKQILGELTYCSKCGAETVWDDSLGNKPLCQACWDKAAAYQRQYYQEHKDEVAASKRRYYQERKWEERMSDIFDTVKRLMSQGLSEKEAISRIETLARTPLPEFIKDKIHEELMRT